MKKLKFFKEHIEKISPIIRTVLGIVSVGAVLYLSISYLQDISGSVEATNIVKKVDAKKISAGDSSVSIVYNSIKYELEPPIESEIEQAKEKYAAKLKRIEDEKRRKEEAERQKKVARINALSSYLYSMNSPMAPYSELILDSCSKYGDHFCKYFLAISGVESGYGRVCSAYSAWGAIAFKFGSWEESIPYSADWLASSYYFKGSNTFEALAQSGYHGGDQQARATWVGNLYYFYNQIPL